MNYRRSSFAKGVMLYAFLVFAFFPVLAYPAENAYLKDLSMQELSGKPDGFTIRSGAKDIRLSDYRGKVVMLHFWARCSACMQELPTLESLYRRFNGRGVAFLAINTEPKGNEKEINAMAKKMGLTFPIYFAGEGDVPDSYWAGGEPQTYFIDRKGNLIGKAFGPRDWSSKEAAGLIGGLLK